MAIPLSTLIQPKIGIRLPLPSSTQSAGNPGHTDLAIQEEADGRRRDGSGWRRRQLVEKTSRGARRSEKAEEMQSRGVVERNRGNPRTLFFIHRWVAAPKVLPGFSMRAKNPFSSISLH
jgi:hypothetical protein